MDYFTTRKAMSDPKTWTKKELESNINILKHEVENMLRQKKGLNKELKSHREQIKYWQQIHDNQYKIERFDDEQI